MIGLISDAYRRLSDLGGIDIEAEYGSDLWVASRLGIKVTRSPAQAAVEEYHSTVTARNSTSCGPCWPARSTANGPGPLPSRLWGRARGRSLGLHRLQRASRCKATAAATPGPSWRCAPLCIDEASGSGCRFGLSPSWLAPLI